MCLIVDKTNNGGRGPILKISDGTVECYKVLLIKGGEMETPYMGVSVDVSKDLICDKFDEVPVESNEYAIVRHGIHTYYDLDCGKVNAVADAKFIAMVLHGCDKNLTHTVIYRCIIPNGKKYFVGNGEYCSESIKFIEKLCEYEII